MSEYVSMQNKGRRLKLLEPRLRKRILGLLELKCERCSRDEATVEYRVFTQIIDMKVCAACADEARRLGTNVEALNSGEGKKRRQAFS